MTLHPLAGTPMWALFLHIAGGSIGLAAGAVALSVRKGERLHRAFGTMFVFAMLAMAAMAIYLGAAIGQWGNASNGAFALYLVTTAWMTVRRPDGRTGAFEIGAGLFALGVASLYALFGWLALQTRSGVFDRFPAPAYFIIGGLVSLAALLDLSAILRGGLAGAPRIARHVWRMCTALFFASGSFFLGQQKVLPASVHGSPVLYALALAPLAAMLFWLARTTFTADFKPQAAAVG